MRQGIRTKDQKRSKIPFTQLQAGRLRCQELRQDCGYHTEANRRGPQVHRAHHPRDEATAQQEAVRFSQASRFEAGTSGNDHTLGSGASRIPERGRHRAHYVTIDDSDLSERRGTIMTMTERVLLWLDDWYYEYYCDPRDVAQSDDGFCGTGLPESQFR